MKTLEFAGRSKNLYHLLEEHSIEQVPGESSVKGKAEITFHSTEQVEIGDELLIGKVSYKITEIKEHRDHKALLLTLKMQRILSMQLLQSLRELLKLITNGCRKPTTMVKAP